MQLKNCLFKILPFIHAIAALEATRNDTEQAKNENSNTKAKLSIIYDDTEFVDYPENYPGEGCDVYGGGCQTDYEPGTHVTARTGEMFEIYCTECRSTNALFKLNYSMVRRSGCTDFWLKIERNGYYSYGSDNCMWSYNDFKLKTGKEARRYKRYRNYARSATYLSRSTINLRFINESGNRHLMLYKLDRNGYRSDRYYLDLE